MIMFSSMIWDVPKSILSFKGKKNICPSLQSHMTNDTYLLTFMSKKKTNNKKNVSYVPKKKKIPDFQRGLRLLNPTV